MLVTKNCNGPLGDSDLGFIPEIVKFENAINIPIARKSMPALQDFLEKI